MKNGLSHFIIILLVISHVPPSLAQDNGTNDHAFSLNILVPTSNPDRLAFVAIIAKELSKIGIEVTKTELEFVTVADKLNNPKIGIVNGQNDLLTTEDGGYDIIALGYGNNPLDFFFWEIGLSNETISPCPDFPRSSRCNGNWYSNDSVNEIYKEASTLRNEGLKRTELTKRLQQIIYEDLPIIVIYEGRLPIHFQTEFALDSSESRAIGLNVMQNDWTTVGDSLDNKLVIGMESPLNPLRLSPLQQSFDKFDEEFSNTMVWQGLYDRDQDLRWNPLIAKDFPIWNDNYTIATVNLRDNVFFKDGHQLDADDVVTTYDFLMNPLANSLSWSSFTHNSGTNTDFLADINSINAINSTSVEFRFIDEMLNDYEFYFFQFGIIPSHIYGNVSNPGVSPFTMDFGQAIIDNPETFGFGSGPFYYKNFTNGLTTYNLVADNNYWKGTNRFSEVKIWRNLDNNTLKSNMINGVYDILIAPSLQASEFNDVLTVDTHLSVSAATTIQELILNQRHPIFGTGKDTPLGKTNPSQASLAARYIRQAINHAVPREKIIEEILDGSGVPGMTSVMFQSFGFDYSLQSYEYNLTKSSELLRAAGYDVPIYLPSTLTDTNSNTDNNGFDQLFVITSIAVIGLLVIISFYGLQRYRTRLKRYEDPTMYSQDYLQRAKKLVKKEKKE